MVADLTTLWMCGLPGYTPLELMDLEFESGFVTISNAPTLSKPRSITFKEGVALLLGLDLVASSLPQERTDLMDSIDSLRDRLSTVLGTPIKLSAVSVAPGTITTLIAKMIESKGGLEIEYHSLYRDVVTERTIKPLEVYEAEGHQYLRAFCFFANDYREFRVDRIKQANPTTISADLVNRKNDSGKIAFSIMIKDLSRDVAERFAISGMSIGSSVSLSSYSRQWIERSVMASGATLELIAPAEIRAELAKRARMMLERYKGL
jgi:proteasome accessory factor C